MAIEQELQRVLPEIAAFRHELHCFPNLTWQEQETAERILKQLKTMPDLLVKTGVGRHGIVVDLLGQGESPMLAFRADMDALPVLEKTADIAYKSQRPGVMHACGHDGHCANLLGAIRLLYPYRSEIKGRLRFIFQPAEEGGAGAREMIADGALAGVDAIYGLHGWPQLDVGKIALYPGAMMAGNGIIRIKVTGKGGHAAMPHLCTDQILAAARIADQLGTVRSRLIDPLDPFVLSITSIHGGSAVNVIPEEVQLTGTMRYMKRATWDCAVAAVTTISHAVAQSLGAKAKVELTPGYPPLINHAGATAWLAEIAQETLGSDKVVEDLNPTMGSEDFAFYLEKVPGSYLFLGQNDGRSGGYPSLHHPEFNYNDRSLETGIRLFVALGLKFGENWRLGKKFTLGSR